MPFISTKKDRIIPSNSFKKEYLNVTLILALAIGLLAITQVFHYDIVTFYNSDGYLSFHISLEVLSIIISLFIALQGWLIFPYQISKRRLLLSVLFLAVGILDFFHMVSYDGMPKFITDSSVAKATWFWILARLTESFGLFLVLSKKDESMTRDRRGYYFAIALFYVSVLIFIVFKWESVLPVLVNNGYGVTKLKKGLEYIISGMHLITMIAFLSDYHKTNQKTSALNLVLSLGFLFISELIFTLYQHVYDFDNLLGHLYKAVGYYYLLRGIYVTTIEEPFVEKEKADKERLKIKQQLKWTMSKLPGAFLSVDTKLNITYVNNSAKQFLLNDEKESIVGKSLNHYIDQCNKNDNENYILQSLEHGKVFIKEKVNIKNRIIQTDVTPIVEPQTGEILGAGAYFFDITEEENENKQREWMLHNLLHQSKSLEQLIDSMPVGFLAIDNEQNIIAINDELLKYHSFTKNDFVMKKLTYFLEKINLDNSYDKLKILRALRGERVDKEIISISDRIYLVDSYAIYDENQQIIGAVAVYQDITELEKLRGEMNKVERLNIVSQMAASIAHEIRNPMAAVRGFIQLLNEQSNQNTQSYYKIILDELDRANGIIHNFLSLSRNKGIEHKQTNLNNIILQLRPLLMADSNLKGHFLELDLDDSLVELELNENEIKQVLLNLARNGIDAMDDGGTLTISTKLNNGKTILSVTDTGVGIPKDKIDHLFTPFYTTKENGTGLGLAVCKTIIENHGGNIEIDLIEGHGTTFKIKFNDVPTGFEDLRLLQKTS